MACNISPDKISKIFREANLPLRVRIIPMPGTSSKRNLEECKKVDPYPSPLTYTSGIKYLMDGSDIEQASLMKKPYPGTENWYGRLDMPIDTIKQIFREALNDDAQLMMHIVGDSTMAVVLATMKEMADGDIWKNKRVRIEHNATSTITDDEVNIIKELGLLVMHTPKYNLRSPIRSFMEKGITVGISPDGTTNPFWDIMMVTSMQSDPEENLTREQAVITYTKTNAHAEFAEKTKGTLAKGMLADLAVLSQDIFTIRTEQLPATQCIMTMIDGKIVYQHLNEQ